VHHKYLLPREAGFWETSWYEPGDGSFEIHQAGGISLGTLICTEMWSMEHARGYGRAGANLLITPRASSRDTGGKWLAGGRVAAIVGGAYSLSSCRTAPPGGPDLGGGGWIVDPDGKVLAVTTDAEPFVTASVDPDAAAWAKHTYPRYVLR
jgi:N-carbamoylputrescine amidase